MSEDNTILVIRFSALGDIVRCFPVMQSIREYHKNSRIIFLTTPPYKSLMKASPFFDEIWTIDRWTWAQVFKWVGFAKELRRYNFSCVYDLQRNDRTLIMSHLAPRFLQKKWFGKKKNKNLPILGGLQVQDIPSAGSIDTSWLTSDIDKFQLPFPYAVLVPGCSPRHPYKRWPAQYYAKIANVLHTQYGITPVLIGTADEKDVLDEITNLAPFAINLCGRTNLLEIAEIAKHAKIAVGNDTGPMHIAGIVGCPVISLFSGMTNPNQSKPIGQNVITLQEDEIANIQPSSVIEKIGIILR